MISKDHRLFNIADISTYRTQLMGIATIMIIVCHAEASRVLMPGYLASICSLGNYGVDIFLFLSGLGIYYSLSKLEMNRGSYIIWYKKRFLRILIPYLIVYVPYCIVFQLLGKYSVVDSVLCLSTLEYWLFHRGAWFVSLILVLYLITPLLHKCLSCNHRWLWAFCFIVSLMVLSNIDIEGTAPTNVLNNIQWAFGRVPSFILGMAISKDCKSDAKISAFWILLTTVLWVILAKIFHLAATAWMIVPLLVFLSVVFIKLLSKVSVAYNSLTLLGKMSLESYLTNITVNSLLLALIPTYISSNIFYGRYLEYSIVVVFGLMSAYIVHHATKKLTNK